MKMRNRNDSKLKILFGAYPWAFDCPGGGERQLLAWKKHLLHNQVDVKLYDPWSEIPNATQIFHFFSVMPGSFQLCEYIKSKGIRLVITPNIWVTNETKNNYPHEEIWRLLNIADCVIVNSNTEADTLSEVYGMSRSIYQVAYNGVEDIFLEEGNDVEFKENYELDNTKYLINVANVEPRKNQINLLKALKNYPDFKLLVVGNARDSQYLKDCESVGGEQFNYIGPLPYGSNTLRSAIKNSCGFVMPSTLETPSIAAIEAAALGVPLLITMYGSTKEYFGEYALYVDPFSIESIDKALNRIVSEKPNPKLQKRAQSFTWNSSSLQLKSIYQDQIVKMESK